MLQLVSAGEWSWGTPPNTGEDVRVRVPLGTAPCDLAKAHSAHQRGLGREPDGPGEVGAGCVRVLSPLSSSEALTPGPHGEGRTFFHLREAARASTHDSFSTATWHRDSCPVQNLCLKMLNVEKEPQKYAPRQK